MRTFIFLAGLLVVANGDKVGDCVIDGLGSTSDLMDGAIYIWGSIERCKQGVSAECTIDVSSAVESVTGAINAILKAVNGCGSLNTVNKGCGMASSSLIERTAGLTAATTEAVVKCGNGTTGASKNKWVGAHYASTPPIGSKEAMCMVNLKGTVKALMGSIKSLMHVSKGCENGGKACTENVLHVISALAGLGQYLSGAVGYCAPTPMNLAKPAKCSHAVSKLVSELSAVGKVGVEMSTQCSVPTKQMTKAVVVPNPVTEVIPVEIQEPRLYEEKKRADNAVTAIPNLVLVGFLPITAIVSFVGGRFYASRRMEAREVNEMAELE